MPPKASWRSLSRVATSPFRKSADSKSLSKGDSRPPSRKASFDLPRSDSPTPAESVAPAANTVVANAAPAPVVTPPVQASNPLPLSNPDQGALDLASPIEPTYNDTLAGALADHDDSGPAVAENSMARDVAQGAVPDQAADLEAAIESHEDAPAPVQPAVPVGAADVGSGYGGTPAHQELKAEEEVAREEPSAAEAAPTVAEIERPIAKVEDEPVDYPFPYTPATDREGPGAELESRSLDPTYNSAVLPIDQAIADHADNDAQDLSVGISSGAVEGKVTKLDVLKQWQVKPAVMTPELTPEDSHHDDVSVAEAPAEVAVTHVVQVDQPPVSALGSTFDDTDNVSKYAATATDPFIDSQTRLISPPHVGHSDAFPRPYTITGAYALAGVDQTEVEAVEDDDLAFVAPATRAMHMHDYQDPMPTSPIVTFKTESHPMDITRWITYTLPGGVKYFHHPGAHIVTDVDISQPHQLHKVSEHLEQINQARHQKKHHHHHHHDDSDVFRLVDDSSTPVDDTFGTTSKYGATAAGQDGAESGTVVTEIWLRSVSVDPSAGFEPITLWVDHLAKGVSINPPWETESKGAGYDDDDAVASQLRYWSFIETHPAHAGLPEGSAEEALEALSWCYSDLLLNPHEDHTASRPFTLSECRELLNLLKALEVQGSGPLQTHIIAQIQVRLAKHRRQALGEEAQAADERTHLLHHHKRKNAAKNGDPFGNFFVKTFVGLFCFGIPYKYVPKGDGHQKGAVVGHAAQNGSLLADSPVFAASVTLMASMLITTAVVFLALPGLENASQLSIIISLFFSASSLFASFINLQRRAWEGHAHAGGPESGHTFKRPKHPFVQSLPLVFAVWSIIALITSAFLYIFRVSVSPSHEEEGEILNDLLRWVVVGVGSALGFVLLIAAIASRRRA